MAFIETRALTKLFTRGDEKIYALNAVNLSIEEGEYVAITGPSGSGKSTLLYILGLIDSPTAGEYLLNGAPTAALGESERARLRNQMMGFIFQSFYLLPRATALRNVMMPLVYAASYERGVSPVEMEARAVTALERVKLTDRMHHLPSQLSGGQRQRVAIARALVNNPRLLLADEPTGNLDSRTGSEVMDLLDELHAQGVTIALVTHDPASAARAKRSLFLRDGRIERDSGRKEAHAS